MQALCLLLQPLWVPKNPAQLGQWFMFSWCPPSPLTPRVLQSSLLQDAPSSKEGPDGDLWFILALYDVWLCLCICSHLLWEEVSLMTTDEALIYVYSRISLGITSLLLVKYLFWFSFLFFLTVVLGSTTGLKANQTPVSGHPGSVGHGFSHSHGVGLKLKQTLVGHSHKFCTTIVPAHLVGRTDCWSKVLWLGWCPYFSLHSL